MKNTSNQAPHHAGFIDPDDVVTNTSANPSFGSVLHARLSRRSMLKGTFGFAATAFFGTGLAACASNSPGGPAFTVPSAKPYRLKLNFNAVAKSLDDAVIVPAGYTATVLYRLGDPIAAGVPAYRNDGTDTAASFAARAGDHHDGMHYFGLGSNGKFSPLATDRALLCMNHEAITPAYLHPAGVTVNGVAMSAYPSPTPVTAARTVHDEVIKEMFAHGVSIIEIRRSGKGFVCRQDSAFNRRITTLTEVALSGPAAKSPFMVTAFSPDGAATRGTVSNCANGYTPWGTYLTCEENWARYFRRIAAADDPHRSAKEKRSFQRYGIAGTGRELWGTVTPAHANDDRFARWNAQADVSKPADGSGDFRNAANTFGWVVEIDPFDPASTPKKRTALGRFAHEGAWLGPVVAGKPLVWYMGCDSRDEYIYKYVSDAVWNPSDANRAMAAGDKYLDHGRLYVARFNADGSGDWLELRHGIGHISAANPDYPFASQADVLVNTMLAADAAGATKMDRPEWGAVNPANGEVYMTLTNNNARYRPLNEIDAANPRFYDSQKEGKTRRGNPNGHVIRWAENRGNVAATEFRWDIFLFGARSTAGPDVNVSKLTAANDFSSPDGLWFAKSGLLWIQTNDEAYTDVTNCMMLAAIPGKVGDGSTKTIVNTDGTTTKAIDTHVGVAPGEDGLRRFLVGPKECEITGLAESPDGRALFVNIQHPGEKTAPDLHDPASFGSHWPEGGNARPRSSTIVITRDDGGPIGGEVS